MLHIVSELMVASALVGGFELPAPPTGVLEQPQPIVRVERTAQDANASGESSKPGRATSGRASLGQALLGRATSGRPSPGQASLGQASLGPLSLGQASPASQLENARGGTGIASDTRLGGEVASNTAQQIVTGANSIDSGSFSGAVGLPVVIQNSGANVLIQNATVINLQFK